MDDVHFLVAGALTDCGSVGKVGNTEIFLRKELMAPAVDHTKLVVINSRRHADMPVAGPLSVYIIVPINTRKL